jgi:hydrogenase large subunit
LHQLASARALDEAFGAKVPWGGTLLRNLVMGAEYIYDHILHFYHLSALDYLDIMAVAQYKGKDPELNKVKDKMVSLVQKKDSFPLTPRYKPDEFSVSDPDIVISAVKHYKTCPNFKLIMKNCGRCFKTLR